MNRRGFVHSLAAGAAGLAAGSRGVRAQAPGDAQDQPLSVILEGAVRPEQYVGQRRIPEDMPLPSVMRALMDFLGEDYGAETIDAHGTQWHRDVALIHYMGVSGDAFRFFWIGKLPPGGIKPEQFDEDPLEPSRRCFEASGFDHEIILQREFAARAANTHGTAEDEAALRARMIESLRDRRRPVVATGVTAPLDTCLVAGYDQGGDVLIGWRTEPGGPGILFERDKQFHQGGWYAGLMWAVFLGDQHERPPVADTQRKALEWGLELMDAKSSRPWKTGFDAYTAWAEALLVDEDFPADDPDALRERVAYIDPWIWDLAERRAYGGTFLGQVAAQQPAAAEALLAAGECFQAEHDMMWQINGLLRPDDREETLLRTLADPEVRRRIAGIVLAAQQQDLEAAGHIEWALAQWNGQEGA